MARRGENLIRAASLAFALAVITGQALSQGFDGGGFNGGGFDAGSLQDIDRSEIERRAGELGAAYPAISAQITNAVLGSLTEGENFCERLGAELRIDCLAESYEVTARKLSKSGAEADIRKAFETAAANLRRVVARNSGAGAKRVIPTVRTRKVNRKATRPLREVSVNRLPRATAQAEEVLDQLSTVLLRSKTRTTRYARLARAVASNKVLLRSRG